MAAPGTTRLRYELFAATWLSYAGFYVTRKVFSVVKGPLKEVLAIDDLSVSHLFTTYLVTYMLGQFASAWLSRRLMNRTQLLVGMGTSIACNLAMGALVPMGPGAYWPLLVCMAVHGFAQATGWPCNVGLMANWTEKAERGRVMAVWGTCYQLGSVFAKALAAFLLGWLGLLWSFWGSSAVLLCITVLFYFWARERPPGAALDEASTDETEMTAPPGASNSEAGEPPQRPKAESGLGLVVALGLTYFGFKFVRYALDSWSILIISERFALPATTAAYLSTAFDWIGFMGVLVSGWVSDRYLRSERMPIITVMAAGGFLATVALATVGLGGLPIFVGLLGLIGFMLMGPDALLSGAAAIESGSRRRAAMAAGIINGLGSTGPIIQEPAIGWLKTAFGLDAVFGLLLAVAGLAAISTAILWIRTRRLGLRL